MATNKTRLFIHEPASSQGPYQSVVEFDVYQDAIDYAKSVVVVVKTVSTAPYAIEVTVFSYDNPSYRFEWNGSDFYQIEVEFPTTVSFVEG